MLSKDITTRKKEEGRRKKEEGRRKKEEGRRKKEEGKKGKREEPLCRLSLFLSAPSLSFPPSSFFLFPCSFFFFLSTTRFPFLCYFNQKITFISFQKKRPFCLRVGRGGWGESEGIVVLILLSILFRNLLFKLNFGKVPFTIFRGKKGRN